jgi:hypothetical protein
MNASEFRTRARAIARGYIPLLSLACVVVGIIIAFTGVRDARAHNATLRQLMCERDENRMVAAGYDRGKLVPCPKVEYHSSLELVGDRDVWSSILLGGYVAPSGGIVFTLNPPLGQT